MFESVGILTLFCLKIKLLKAKLFFAKIPKIMSTYEMVYILSSNGKVSSKDEQGKVNYLIKQSGGKVVKEAFLGKKRVAFPIKKELEGVYNEVVFEMENAKLLEFEQALKANSLVMRKMVKKVKES